MYCLFGRRAAELQQHQTQLEQLEQQRLTAERDTGRHAQALAQEKHNLAAMEQQLQAARQRIHDGEAQLNHLKSCVPFCCCLIVLYKYCRCCE